MANRSDTPLHIRSISLVLALIEAQEPVRMFRNGYQSCSPTGVATFGVDVDPSTMANFEFVQATQHADQHRALDGELRSECLRIITGCDFKKNRRSRLHPSSGYRSTPDAQPLLPAR